MSTSLPIEILLVEDNPGDVRLTREMLRESRMESHLRVAPDGMEALAMLRGEGPYGDAGLPDLILLDLHLPRLDGRQVLAAIKSDRELRRIPVVMLTSSRLDEDARQSYALDAGCFLSKPRNLDEIAGVVKSIEDFWFSLLRLPS